MAQIIRYPPFKKNITIKRICREHKDLYFIYAISNDTLYKIVSYIDEGKPRGEYLIRGNSYTLWLQSIYLDSINGFKEPLPSDPHYCTDYANHTILKETRKGYKDVFDSRQLNGKRIINESNWDSLPSTDHLLFTTSPEGMNMNKYKKWYYLKFSYGGGINKRRKQCIDFEFKMDIPISYRNFIGIGTGFGNTFHLFTNNENYDSREYSNKHKFKSAYTIPLYLSLNHEISNKSMYMPYFSIETGANWYLKVPGCSGGVFSAYIKPILGLAYYTSYKRKLFSEIGLKNEFLLKKCPV